MSRIYTVFAILFVLCMSVTSGAQAQTTALSAVITVLGEGVTLLRAGTVTPLPLRLGSIAPFGAGDQVITGINGRVLVTFPDVNSLYVLPDSRYTLTDFAALDEERFRLAGELYGIAIQVFEANPADWDYQLVTPGLTVVTPSEHFAVWALPGRFQTVISAAGTATAISENFPDGMDISAGFGWMPEHHEGVIALEPPYHAVAVLALAIDCRGVVSTGGSEGLRLRRGAALDYQIVGALKDGQAVNIVGITENRLWYRIPYLTGFGWLYSDLVETTEACPNLPISPSLTGEANEIIAGVSGFEVSLLSPFYLTPRDNGLFYR